MATDPARERRIAELAARQHDNVTRSQLLELGLGPAAIAHRARTGRLHREHLGVYSLGRPARTPLEHASAAVLACGPTALLSHTAALALWELGPWPRRMEVTTLADRGRPTITVHRSRSLGRRDIRRHQGIAVTSPARTLLDCAPRMTPRALSRAVNDALRRRLVRRSQLNELLERCPRHPGARCLRPLAERPDGPTRSEFEDAFLAFCARFGLPRPQVNVVVLGYEVDAYFPAARLIVELDGWSFHHDRGTFESDRERDAHALAAGLGTVRITWQRLHRQPAREAKRLLAILKRRDTA